MNTLRGRIERAIAEKVLPGCVVGYIQKGGTPLVEAFGTLAYDNRPVVEDTVYDLASITKSLPTASLALMIADEGRLMLSDKVKKFIPELQNDYDATIEDLLRYRVRGPQMSRLVLRTFEEMRAHILDAGFSGPPGKEEYTNLPAYLLGLVVERVGNASIAAQGQQRFFGPLGMDRTTFFPTASDCAPTEIGPDGNIICGIVHDESSRPFAAARRTVGHAGLFSTAGDILEFLGALLYGRFPAIVSGAEDGLGWAVNETWFMGTQVSAKAFGKTGFTGTHVVVDCERKNALVLLSNRTYPKRPPDATSKENATSQLRRDVADIVFSYE